LENVKKTVGLNRVGSGLGTSVHDGGKSKILENIAEDDIIDSAEPGASVEGSG
jgi:hypothetical protein